MWRYIEEFNHTFDLDLMSWMRLLIILGLILCIYLYFKEPKK